ncbi:TPA: hypothetical protein QC443_002590 [Bacillus cereus]|uniref:hypothetical protein n=1 Tax=Bacillus cereus TaxID=1396 RepID=UPI00192525DE|nr:hypothetical protein [Bacillus cereus]MBL3768664.1 hypothetical protein [Bacillus cereus]MBL3881183.1 hypothetical protein [Bacillus cereus]HDR7980311.1 hypothetical protein [Bacillus cereus]HDR8514889.1 hypothetical protein [Bacillus cereus]
MEARHIDLYEQALEHEKGQAIKWFDEVNRLRAELQMAESLYKHHKEESERLQIVVTKGKEKLNVKHSKDIRNARQA